MKFEVTDSTGAILPVRKGADSGAMTVFKSYGGGKDHVTIQKNMNVLDKIKGFHTVYERGVAVFDVRSSGIGRDHPEIAVPVFRSNRLERALCQAAKDEENGSMGINLATRAAQRHGLAA